MEDVIEYIKKQMELENKMYMSNDKSLIDSFARSLEKDVKELKKHKEEILNIIFKKIEDYNAVMANQLLGDEQEIEDEISHMAKLIGLDLNEAFMEYDIKKGYYPL
jgi:hypothetical protein